MDLSIVIPAYEESHKIVRDIRLAAAFLEQEGLSGELIIVDDGSRDDTAKVAEECVIPASVALQVIRSETNRGKGHAVRSGMQQTKGEYVMFADSGSCVPYEQVLRGLELIKADRCELAHGSRKLPESEIGRPQVWYRQILSKLFHWAMFLTMGVPGTLTDTQCGFKIYRGDVARSLFGQSVIDGFAFDIEIILRARQQGYRILEFPITWTADPDSRLSVTRTPRAILAELREIRRALGRG